MAREDDSDVAADLRVAHTTLGMVRIHITAEDGTALDLMVRGRPLPARVAPLPFVPHRYVR